MTGMTVPRSAINAEGAAKSIGAVMRLSATFRSVLGLPWWTGRMQTPRDARNALRALGRDEGFPNMSDSLIRIFGMNTESPLPNKSRSQPGQPQDPGEASSQRLNLPPCIE